MRRLWLVLLPLVDALTKRGIKLRKVMAEFCMNPKICQVNQKPPPGLLPCLPPTARYS